MLRSRDRETDDLTSRLAAAQRRIAELEKELARRTSRDPLAESLLTLNAFRVQLEMDVKRSHRYQRPLTVALLDVDGFRRINVTHGYGTGDKVLATVGRLIAEGTRVNDLACRIGGDEFAMMLPETASVAAMLPLQRILLRLEDAAAGEVRGLSASIGIASLERGHTPEQLLAAARSALETARAAGGGQAMIFAGGEQNQASGDDLGHGDVVAALASALEERDRYTGEHSESVVDLVERVTEALGLPTDEVARFRTAALLHDIGKVGIPDEILHKPGPLSEREWEIMHEHPAIGERILRAIPGMGQIARIVRAEHERWDGSGYPDGLAGTDIPLGARVILACDAYHAMISDRPYRKAMEHREALSELSRNAGSQFDPDVVEALIGYVYGRRQAGRATG